MEKLKKNREFQSNYKKGKKFYGIYSLIFINKNNLTSNRYGFVASKKVGNAVVRNRVKRLFREYIRLNEDKILKNFDIILVSKKEFNLNLKYQDIEKDLNKLFKKAFK